METFREIVVDLLSGAFAAILIGWFVFDMFGTDIEQKLFELLGKIFTKKAKKENDGQENEEKTR